MKRKILLLLLSCIMILGCSTTAFASMTDSGENTSGLPGNPYTNVSTRLTNMANSNYSANSTQITASGVSNYSGGDWNSIDHSKEFSVNLPDGENEKAVNVTAVYPNYLYFDGEYWTVTVNVTKVYATKGKKMTFGVRYNKPGLCINDGDYDDNSWANVLASVKITNSSTGAAMPNGLYQTVFGVTDLDWDEVYRFYDTNMGNYYTDPSISSPYIFYDRDVSAGHVDFSGYDTEDIPGENQAYQRFYWRVGDRNPFSLRYGTTTKQRYASSFNFLALLSHSVKYTTDSGGSSLTPTSERVMDGANPTGATLTTKPDWKFINWTTKNAVTLKDGTRIPAGGAITMAQIKNVVVNDDQQFDAHHEPRPQIEVSKITDGGSAPGPVLRGALKGTPDGRYYQVEDEVIYRIPVWNAVTSREGVPTKETNLVISDTLPSDLELLDVDVDYVNSFGEVNRPIINVNKASNSFTVTFPVFRSETPEIIVKAKFKEDVRYSKDITNTVTMKTTDSYYPNGGPDTSDDSVTITEVAPKLSIEKKVAKQEYHVGDTVHYTIVAKNEIEHSWADDVIISDSDLSIGQNIVAGSVTSTMGTVKQADRGFQVNIPQLKGGQTATIEFDVKLDNKTLNSNELYNKVILSSKQTGTGNEAEVTSSVVANVEYQWDGPHPNKDVPQGGTYDWGITYQTDKTFKLGDKVKDTVNGQKGSWVFQGWDHAASFKLVDDTVIKGKWEFVNEYDITTSIENGRITPTEKDIPEGSNRLITYTPNLNYQVKSVTVDGTPQDIKQYPASYPFDDIKANHDVKVVCELIPGLDIVKTADKDIYNAGDTVTYTITVSQTIKGAEARDVVITDTMPEGVTLNKDSITGDVTVVSTDDHSYTVSIASLKDKPVTYTYTGVTAEEADNESLINVVDATGSNVPDGARDDENVTSLTPKPEITKVVSNETPICGEEVIYFVNVKEPQDGIVVRNAVITDALPSGIEYVPDSLTYDGNLAEATVEDGKITVNIPVLEDEVAISFKAKVTAVEGSVDNVAVLSGDKIDPIEDNAIINVVEPQPTLTKTASVESGSLGDTVSYTVQAASDLTLVDAVIKDTVPEGLKLVADSVKCSDEKAEVKVEGNTIEVKAASLHDAVTITYDVVLEKEGVHKNIATLEAYNFPKGPLSAEEQVEAYPAEPVIEKSVTPETAMSGDEVTYTIKAYTNKGTVHNAVINDQLPDGVTYVRGSMTIEGDEAKASVEKNAITVNIAKLSKGVTITFKAKVTAITGSINNVAILSGDNMTTIQDDAPLAIAEPTPTITKKASIQEGSIGDTVSYTVVANSNTELKDAVIKDEIPDGLRLVESSVKCSDKNMNIEISKNTITATAASLKESVTITYDCVIEKDGAHKNIVTLAASNFPKGPVSADATVTGQLVKPVVTKKVDREDGSVGETVAYTITANAEKGVIYNAVITDKLPKGIEVDEKSVYASGNNEVAVDGDSIVVKCKELTTEPVTISYSAKLTKSGDQTNVVTVTGDNVKDPAEAKATVKVKEQPKEVKEKEGNPSTPADGTPDRANYKTGDFAPYILVAILLALIAAIAAVAIKRKKDGKDDDHIGE